ncbi:NAD-dependent protein deacylase [Bacillus sp. B-jedd]|uniref:NAD-dependent protein deacylase n=1 Tax=Bacillus sp. B-jedd TaxID=1476857 RepID=UPI000515570C|nr:NAD-dependent protein deacylase [Bacillus sp. B-jedd]CEG27263.1 NAD-dependent deacetylase [Bacillus sp. B-jedd]
MLIQDCADIIRKSRNIVVLTGAGISTESGIKDFRSRTGIYQEAPEYVLSIGYFLEKPQEFYQFAFDHLYHPGAKPNKGHEILAKWETEGRVSKVITQNIDGLHQKAGNQDVIEFHGTMETASCLHCGVSYTAAEMARRLKEMNDFYICSRCETKRERDRYIKPDVVLFGDAGEWFTPEGFAEILDWIETADCVLVLGTSLKVVPFASFPQYRGDGVPLIIVNRDETAYDHGPDTIAIHDSIGKTLSAIDELL